MPGSTISTDWEKGFWMAVCDQEIGMALSYLLFFLKLFSLICLYYLWGEKNWFYQKQIKNKSWQFRKDVSIAV